MINTFSLILAIITGISGIFWCIKKFYVLVCGCEWYRSNIFFKKSNNFCFQSKSVFILLFSFFKNIFGFLSSLFPMLLLVFIIRSFVIEPFQIPSGSMMPTLLIGDFILVKKFSYGIKNPFNQKILVKIGYPKRGDVVVFKYPKDPALDYIKRIIGMPGDKIVYNIVSKKLMIYPKDTDHIYMKSLPIIYSNIVPSNFIQEFFTTENGSVNTTFVEIEKYHCNEFSKGIRLIQTTEELDGEKHDILTMIPPGDQNFIKMYNQHMQHLISEWIIPEGAYFVMGDNRDNSSDSRYWGYVPEQNVIGKATIIWMSFKKQEGKWPVGFRLYRIGYIK